MFGLSIDLRGGGERRNERNVGLCLRYRVVYSVTLPQKT